jgi:cobalt-zinc-cadmium efflux system membrane fusion protein
MKGMKDMKNIKGMNNAKDLNKMKDLKSKNGIKKNEYMKSTNLVLLIVVITVFYIVGCKSNAKTEKISEHEVLPPNTVEFSVEQYKTAGIQLGKVEQRLISNVLKISGTIQVTPQSLATVCAPYGGFIKNTDLIEGSQVAKGQTLAMIENIAFIELQQGYFETKSKCEFAENDYNRQKDLYNSNVNSVKVLQQAESEYKTLKAQLNGFIQKLSILSVDVSRLSEDKITSVLPLVSPISGYIKKVNVNIGKSINPTDVLFEIVNTQNLTLELIVFEKDICKISIGQKLKFTTGNSQQTEYTGTIYQLGKVLDNDKTIKVYASINKPDNYLIAGMFINAQIDIANNKTTCVPIESIVQFDEKFYIFTFKEKAMENGKEITLFEVVEVKKGAENEGYAEISLPNNFDIQTKQIVVKGAYSILAKFKNSGEMSC